MLNNLRAAFRGLEVEREQRILVVQAVVIGIGVWGVVTLLKESIHWLFHEVLHWVEHAPTPLVLFVPLAAGALLTGLIAQYRAVVVNYRDEEGEIESLNAVAGDGIERAIALYFAADPVAGKGLGQGKTGLEARWQIPTLGLAVRKFLASLATLGSGASGGLEAGSALIGESLGAWYYQIRSRQVRIRSGDAPKETTSLWIAPNPDYLQAAQLSGIAAAVTVLLGAPLSAAFFASEVMYRNRPLLSKAFYALISAMTAQLLSSLVAGAAPTMFGIPDPVLPPLDQGRYWLGLLLVGFGVAFVGQIYRVLVVQSHDWFSAGFPNRLVRLLVGFGMTGAIALGVTYLARWLGITERGLELVLGSGESMVVSAFAGQVTLAMALIGLVAKLLATLWTVNSGGAAGLLVPSFFLATMVATAFSLLLRFDPTLLIAPALTGSLVAIVHTPVAAVLFAVEEFGAAYLAPALIVLVVTALLSHPRSIYRSQRTAVDRIQLLPGYDIELLRVPPAWIGQTLNDLHLADQYDVHVVGLLDRTTGDERPRALFDATLAAAATLVAEDTILVYGEQERLRALEIAMDQP